MNELAIDALYRIAKKAEELIDVENVTVESDNEGGEICFNVAGVTGRYYILKLKEETEG